MSSVLRLSMLRHFQTLRVMGARMLTSERVGVSPTRGHEIKDPLPPALLTFKDPRAFQSKSWWEIVRALGVFRLCSYPVLVNNCGRVSVMLCIAFPFAQSLKYFGYGRSTLDLDEGQEQLSG